MIDYTSGWLFLQRRRSQIGLGLLGCLLFLSGWQLGRVTSPYFQANPIIFAERSCSVCSSGGGQIEELTALQVEGDRLASASTQPKTEASKSPKIAGLQATPNTVAGTTAQGQYVASKNSKLFHDISCPSVSRIKVSNRRYFTSAAAAQAAGLTPSKCTLEKLGKAQ